MVREWFARDTIAPARSTLPAQQSGSGNNLWLIGAIAFGVWCWSKRERSPAQHLGRRGVDYLVELIEEWRPHGCHSEHDWEISLQSYLQGRFSRARIRVERQYAFAHSRADIVVDDTYAIELKADLAGESEIKRLHGQVKAMKEHFDGGLVLLCGTVEESAFVGLREDLREHDDRDEERLIFDVLAVPPWPVG